MTLIRSLLGNQQAFKRYYSGDKDNPNGRWELKKFNASLYDVLMGVLVGGLVAFVVVRFLRRLVAWVVGYVERVTDPLVSRSRSGPASRSRSARRL